jgi:hypothetical protein
MLPGRFVVRQTPPPGFAQTMPVNGAVVVNVASGSNVTGVTFGDHSLAPKVLEVFVRSSSWSSAFQTALARLQLGDGASGLRLYPARQPPLPWLKLDQFVVRFDQPVNTKGSDLSVQGIKNSRGGVGFNAVAGSPNTYVFTLNAPLLRDGSASSNGDRFVLDLKSGGVRSSASSTALDGDNDNVPGGNFFLRFNVLEGDVDHKADVNVLDYAQTLRRIGSSADASARYSVFNDLDGNGLINYTDLKLLRSRLGRTLPAVQAPAAAVAPGVYSERRPARRGLFADAPVLS